MSQREAAVEAIQKIGVCQIYDINKSIWDGQKKYKKEFNCRFCKLKETIVIPNTLKMKSPEKIKTVIITKAIKRLLKAIFREIF